MSYRFINDKIESLDFSYGCFEALNGKIEQHFKHCKILLISTPKYIKMYAEQLKFLKRQSQNNIKIKTVDVDKLSGKYKFLDFEEDTACIIAFGDKKVVDFAKLLSKRFRICYVIVPITCDDDFLLSNSFCLKICNLNFLEKSYLPLGVCCDFHLLDKDENSTINILFHILQGSFSLLEQKLNKIFFDMPCDYIRLKEFGAILEKAKDLAYIVINQNLVEKDRIYRLYEEYIKFLSANELQYLYEIYVLKRLNESKNSKFFCDFTHFTLLESICDIYSKFVCMFYEKQMRGIDGKYLVCKSLNDLGGFKRTNQSLLEYDNYFNAKKCCFILDNMSKVILNEVEEVKSCLKIGIDLFKYTNLEQVYGFLNGATKEELANIIYLFPDQFSQNSLIKIIKSYGLLEF